MKLHVIQGNSQKLDGGSMFGNAPKALWSRWVQADELNRINLSTRALLLQTDNGENILFETGVGAFFDQKLKDRYGVQENEHLLLKNLKSLGISDSDIDAVVLSHLHFDHAGGLLPEYGDPPIRLLFPNATYYVGKKHWERAKNPHVREKASFIPIIQELLEQSNRLTLIDDGDILDYNPKISFHFSDGHTIGLMASEISLKSGPLIFISDIAPGIPWIHVPITMGYDRYPELIINEKKNILEETLENHGYFFFTHDPVTACAKIELDENGKYKAIPIDITTLS
ncbi:MAG: MBL fold metallo-hydrolase [Chlamydiota bacterium]